MNAQPKFELDSFTDLVYDQNGKGNPATIVYEGYYYDGFLRLVKLEVAIGKYDEHTEESIVNIIELREGKRVEMECRIEII